MTAALRAEICRVGASLYQRGYVHATAGNISVRTETGFLITPTDACLGQLEPARLAEIDANGAQTGGDRASKTLALHQSIYAADPLARCVIHTHSTHLVALTLAGVWSVDDILPPITPYFVMKVGHVPLIPYHRPGDPAVGDAVSRRIAAMRDAGTPNEQIRTSVASLRQRLLDSIPETPLSVLVDHIDHIAKVAGVDHVGIGSDFDGVTALPIGMEDVTMLPRIAQHLIDRGYSDTDIKKILGGNMLRVLETAIDPTERKRR